MEFNTDYLKDQKNYKRKSGQLIGYIKKNIPSKYHSIIFNHIEYRPYQILDVIKYSDIDFTTIKKSYQSLKMKINVLYNKTQGEITLRFVIIKNL